MKAHKVEKRQPAYFLFTGIAFLLLGVGNLTLLINPESIFNIIFGVSGIPLIIGGVYLIRQSKK